MSFRRWEPVGPAVILMGALLAALPLQAQDPPLGPDLAGTTGRKIVTQMAFTLPIAGLDADRQRDFFFGNRLFNTNWVAAPSSTEKFDGLGPTFNRVSCDACHLRDGRGQVPDSAGEPMQSALVRISVWDAATKTAIPHPAYGDQLNDRAISGVKAEARVRVSWAGVPGKFGDGSAYSLRKPTIQIDQPAYGPLGKDLLTSLRVAPAVIGLGLLEAVPDADILALAEKQAKDGIVSGRPNRLDGGKLGRFGWKANQPDLRTQNAGAANGDIGITTSLFPKQNCPPAQKACLAAPNGGEPEMSDAYLEKLTVYTQTLAVPRRREWDTPELNRGEALFTGFGCAACHVSTLKTGDHKIPELRNQTIHPLTDLLLHDMGPGLADGRPDHEAGPSEWRTPPLWGLGMIPQANQHEHLLHDGRARGPAEAILWHGGEAETAKEAFRTAPASDRAALVAFLRSL